MTASPKVKYETPVPETLRAFLDKNAHKVYAVCCGGGYSFEARNGFAYDVLLRGGWRMSDDRCHMLIEPTIALIMDQVRGAVPCDCNDCIEFIKDCEKVRPGA